MDEELSEFIRKERQELAGSFCRSCGYCMPCPAGIEIFNCARMNMLLHGVSDSAFTIFHGDTLTNDWDMLRESNPAKVPQGVTVLRMGATEGVEELARLLAANR